MPRSLRKGTAFEIKDLNSTRGTLVNGQKLADAIELRDGDTLQIGEVQLTFNKHVVEIEEGDDEQSTVYAAIDVLNQSDRHFPLIKPEAKFRALRLIGQELGGTLVLSEVLDRIFNSLFEIFPRAERGFVLLKDAASGALMPEIIRSRSGPAGELKISKTVLNRVLEGRSGDSLQRPGRGVSRQRQRVRQQDPLADVRPLVRYRSASRSGSSRSTRATAAGDSSKTISTCWPPWPTRSAWPCRMPSCTRR